MTKFSGAVYVQELDESRLTEQLKIVYRVMKDGIWRTVEELSALTGFKNQQSLDAQVRNLRKFQYNGWDARLNPTGHFVARRNRNGIRGLSEYRLIVHREFQKEGSLKEAYDLELERMEKQPRRTPNDLFEGAA